MPKKFCCKKKCKEAKEGDAPDCYQLRQGGTSTISRENISKYCDRLQQDCGDKLAEAKTWEDLEGLIIAPVTNFMNKIHDDPVLRMNFNDSVLKQMPVHTANGRSFRLLGDSVLEAAQIINAAATSAPVFDDQSITGVPIYALFLDYLQTSWGQDLFSHKTVNECLKELFDYFSHEILQTEKSLAHMHGWVYGPALKYWVPQEYVIPDISNPITMGFPSWEAFFLREFKEGARPVEGPAPGSGVDEEDIITLACESYPLVQPAQPTTNVQLKDEFWLKDNKYSLYDIFDANEKKNMGAAEWARYFEGGTIYQAFLDPWTYHHWHSPVNGTVVDTYMIDGCYYLQNPGILEPDTDDDYINSQPFLTSTSTRRIFIIKADNEKIGHIAIVFVGMCEVSTCISLKKPGDRVKKGEQIGHFEFGGSSHAVLFQKDCILDFSRNVEKAYYVDPKTKQMLSRRININKEMACVRNVMTGAQFKAYMAGKNST